MALADLGTEQAVKTDPHLHAGINVAHGDIVHPEIVAAMAGLI